MSKRSHVVDDPSLSPGVKPVSITHATRTTTVWVLPPVCSLVQVLMPPGETAPLRRQVGCVTVARAARGSAGVTLAAVARRTIVGLVVSGGGNAHTQHLPNGWAGAQKTTQPPTQTQQGEGLPPLPAHCHTPWTQRRGVGSSNLFPGAPGHTHHTLHDGWRWRLVALVVRAKGRRQH